MLPLGRISIWSCNSCLHLCLIQPVWYWQHYEYSFFGRTFASGFVADSDFPCMWVCGSSWLQMLPTCQMVNMQPQFSRPYCCLCRNQYTFWIFLVYFLSLWIVNEIWSQQNDPPGPQQFLWVLSFLHLQRLYSPLEDIPLLSTSCYWDLMR